MLAWMAESINDMRVTSPELSPSSRRAASRCSRPCAPSTAADADREVIAGTNRAVAIKASTT